MRRAVAIGLALTALAAGCGGESDRSQGRPSTGSPAPQGPAAAASPQVTDGRLGDAVVARPGSTRISRHNRRIPPAVALPPSGRKAVGAEQNCQNADIQPTPSTLATASDAVFCLMNAMRQNAGLPSLRQNAILAKASIGHSQDMVENKYFAHDSLDGRDVVARLKEVSYIPKDAEWIVGENLVWGSGAMATPRALVDAWMNSKPHRTNLLSGDFVEVGMGTVLGVPTDEVDSGVTITTDFGTRFTDALAGEAGPTATNSSGTIVGGETAAARRIAAKRRAALRRCAKRHGAAKRRCVRAARKLR